MFLWRQRCSWPTCASEIVCLDATALSSTKVQLLFEIWSVLGILSPAHLPRNLRPQFPRLCMAYCDLASLLWILPLSLQQWLNLPPNFFTLDWPRCSCFVPELRLGRLRLKPWLLRSAQIYMTYGVLGTPLPIPLRVHFSDKQKHIRAQAPHFTLCALAPGDAFLEPLAWSLTNGSSWLSF